MVLIVILGSLTHGQLPKWKNRVNFWTDVIRKAPNQPQPYNNRGLAYYGLGKHREALMDYSYALKINSNFVDAYLNRGNVYHSLRMYGKAIGDFTRAIEIRPNHATSYYNRMLTYGRIKQYDKAKSDMEKLKMLESPRDPDMVWELSSKKAEAEAENKAEAQDKELDERSWNTQR